MATIYLSVLAGWAWGSMSLEFDRLRERANWHPVFRRWYGPRNPFK